MCKANYIHYVKEIMSHGGLPWVPEPASLHVVGVVLACRLPGMDAGQPRGVLNNLTSFFVLVYNHRYRWVLPKTPNAAFSAKQGVLHPHPESVTAALFQDSSFFDPSDLIQVKYEMLRRVEAEQIPVSRAAHEAGLSRPSFYQAQAAIQQIGLAGSWRSCSIRDNSRRRMIAGSSSSTR
jgi:hypothetical protein